MNKRTDLQRAESISYDQREQLVEKGRLLHTRAVSRVLSNPVACMTHIFFHQNEENREQRQLKYT